MIAVTMRIVGRLKMGFGFCEGLKKYSRSAMSLQQLKNAIERQHSFVRKNYEELGYQLIASIESKQWSFARKMLLIINVNELDSWLMLRKIAKALNNTCNNLILNKMNREEVLDLLSVMLLLRFEPRRAKTDSFKGRPSEVDDSTSFVNQLEKHVRQVSLQEDQTYFVELARRTLHTNASLYLPIRQEFQRRVLANLPKFMESRSLLNELLIRGCVSQYWTKEFKAKILSRNLPENYVKALKFEDLSIHSKIHKASQQSNTNAKTEAQIKNILEGFGYSVQDNVLINNYEVDFLISNKLIVQYNGHHHYIINSKKLIPTAKDRWKQNVLLRRNFTVSTIPYSEWKELKLFEEKRKYLVNKVEGDWLASYKYSKDPVISS